MSLEQNLLFLVDDDADDRTLFEDAVNQTHFNTKVISFSSVDTFLEHLNDASHQLPKAVFLDLHLPIVGGEECLIKIRENKAYNNICVVIYSTSFLGSTADRLKSMGANFYIQKPSSFSLLITILQRSLTSIFEKEDTPIKDADFIHKN
ncbi:response regulator [Zobellia nedashkovskayae]